MERLSRALALWRLEGVGPKRFASMLKQDSTFSLFFDQKNFSEKLYEILPTQTRETRPKPDWKGVDTDLQWLQKPQCYALLFGEPGYPEWLTHISNPPGMLFIQGALSALSLPAMAVVGSRRPSAYGRNMGFELSKQLSERGWCIVSGMALGIDTAAHQGAVSLNKPTIAVLGNSLDFIYPRSNRVLSQQIQESGGALLSEFPLGTPPIPAHFPRRNRIISGLSRGVLVVEAAQKSGSLVTAKLALEQNREVFAIPGIISNPLSEGPHLLIQQGAKLVVRVEDIMDEFSINELTSTYGGVAFRQLMPLENRYTGSQGTVWQAVDHDCTPTDIIVERTGLSTGMVAHLLMELVIDGGVEKVPGGYIRR